MNNFKMKKVSFNNIIGAVIIIFIAFFWMTTSNVTSTGSPDATHTCPYKFRGEPSIVYLSQTDCNKLDYSFDSVMILAFVGVIIGVFTNKGWTPSKKEK